MSISLLKCRYCRAGKYRPQPHWFDNCCFSIALSWVRVHLLARLVLHQCAPSTADCDLYLPAQFSALYLISIANRFSGSIRLFLRPFVLFNRHSPMSLRANRIVSSSCAWLSVCPFICLSARLYLCVPATSDRYLRFASTILSQSFLILYPTWNKKFLPRNRNVSWNSMCFSYCLQ